MQLQLMKRLKVLEPLNTYFATPLVEDADEDAVCPHDVEAVDDESTVTIGTAI